MAEFDLSPTSPNPAPSVNLNVGSGGALAGGLDPEIGMKNPINPLGMVGQWADIQNQLNQNRLFQQTFQARQLSGQILASAPDTETAIKELMANPETAPFAGETINSLRQGQLALTQIGGEVQKQGQGVMDSFYKMLPAVIADPKQYDALAAQALSVASPAARTGAFAAMSSLKSALFDGLDHDPQGNITPLGVKQFNSRMVGYSMGAGVPPQALDQLFGTATTIDRGTSIQGATQLPAYLGGALEPSGSPISINPAPSVQTVPVGASGTPTTGVLSGTKFTPATIEGSSNALEPGQAQPSVNLIHGPGNPTEGPLVGPSQTQSEINKQHGSAVGDINNEMISDARGIPQTMVNMRMMGQAIQNFQAGGGANIRQNVGQFLQALHNAGFSGITQDKIDEVANKSLPWGQVFDTLVRPYVINQLKEAAQGTGRVMRSEVDAFLESLDKNSDPRAISTALNVAMRKAQMHYDAAQHWPQFQQDFAAGKVANTPGLDSYYQWWNENRLGKLPSKIGGVDFSPLNPQKALGGGGPAKVTHKWDPKLGRIVPVGG